jgi:hypothetical protein
MKVRFRAFVPADVLTVREHMPYALTEATTGIVAYNPDTTETLAVFVAEDWTQTSVSVHQVIVKTMVLRHGWLQEIADFIFTKAGRKKMYAVVPDVHAKAISLNEKIGFQQVARLDDAVAEGIDYLVMELKRENCPYWVQPALQKVS